MPRDLVDLLWRDHPGAPGGGTRGPRAKVSTTQAVRAAVAVADRDGLDAVTLRRLAAELEVAPNALYTHVGSRDELVVLMADAVRLGDAPSLPRGTWRARVAAVAEAELALLRAHPWLVDVTDQRVALGPGTIATYDAQLHAFDGTGLTDVERDAALTFVVDAVRAAARSLRPDPHAPDMQLAWASAHERLARYLGDRHALAQRVGAAAGAEMGAPWSAEHAWRFALARVLDGLEALVEQAGGLSPRRVPAR